MNRLYIESTIDTLQYYHNIATSSAAADEPAVAVGASYTDSRMDELDALKALLDRTEAQLIDVADQAEAAPGAQRREWRTLAPADAGMKMNRLERKRKNMLEKGKNWLIDFECK